MTLRLGKESIDLGIVTPNPAALIAFYRDVLGLEDAGEIRLPGIVVRALRCGSSVVKIVAPDAAPAPAAAPGALTAAAGYRYWTITVADAGEVVERCRSLGATIVMEPREVRPGITGAVVADPDGNAVELVHYRAPA